MDFLGHRELSIDWESTVLSLRILSMRIDRSEPRGARPYVAHSAEYGPRDLSPIRGPPRAICVPYLTLHPVPHPVPYPLVAMACGCSSSKWHGGVNLESCHMHSPMKMTMMMQRGHFCTWSSVLKIPGSRFREQHIETVVNICLLLRPYPQGPPTNSRFVQGLD